MIAVTHSPTRLLPFVLLFTMAIFLPACRSEPVIEKSVPTTSLPSNILDALHAAYPAASIDRVRSIQSQGGGGYQVLLHDAHGSYIASFLAH